MDKFGIIGHPVSNAMSPVLFEAAYGGKYRYDRIEGADFRLSWERFLREYRAINVTAPFKELAFREVLSLSGRSPSGAGNDGCESAVEGVVIGPAAKIGATNLVVRRVLSGGGDESSDSSDSCDSSESSNSRESRGVRERIEAYNSDFSGVVLSVAEAYFPGITKACYDRYGDRGYVKVHQFVRENIRDLFPEAPQALVVGCGGAGKAAAVAAAELGFQTALMNRTASRAQAFAGSLPEYGFIPVPISDLRASIRECDLVIYTLPCPVDALAELTEEDFAGENPYSQAPSKVILEANYKTPSFSGAVLEKLEAAGAQYVHGSRWCVYQAMTGYSIMTGEVPDVAAIASAVRQ